jgi:spoIIIJ-associated protein
VTQGQTPDDHEPPATELATEWAAESAAESASLTPGPAAEPAEPGSVPLDLTAEGTGGDAGPSQAGESSEAAAPRVEVLEQEGEIAADYLEGLLDIADLDGDIDMDVVGERASVSIVGGKLGHLVGRDGEVLEALQELTRLAVMRVTGERSRLMLDLDGYRAARRRELTGLGLKAAQDARSSGEPVKLRPMTPFERKVVHDAVATAGMRSESEGEEPDRRVVVFPA